MLLTAHEDRTWVNVFIKCSNGMYACADITEMNEVAHLVHANWFI